MMVPKYHYGSHYSSANSVLFYMIRLEPFTQQFIKLQNGFDHPDRMFHSIEETWLSVSEQNTMDVKELIPEFYHLPSFLQNANQFDFGVKQNKQRIDNVILPLWSKNDPRLFIKKQRQALESEIVSANLQGWIDLIFGYKQRGQEAVDALNVFFFITYEGAVDIDAITDPTDKKAKIQQINGFGQTPRQLFTKPHPKRSKRVQEPPLFAKSPLSIAFSKVKTTATKYVNDIVVLQHGKQVITASRHSVIFGNSCTKRICWGYRSGAVHLVDGDKLLCVKQGIHYPYVSTACASEDFIVTGGVDGVVKVFKQSNKWKSLKLEATLCGHDGKITTLKVSRAYSAVVSGSNDGTIIIWDLNRLAYVRTLQFSAPEEPTCSVANVAISDTTGFVCASSGSLLRVWTINGSLLAQMSTSSAISALHMATGPSWLDDYNAILTGHADGTIRVWKWRELDKPKNGQVEELFTFKVLEGHTSRITAFYMLDEQLTLHSVDSSGSVLCWYLNVEKNIKKL
mmetsp:Transcript_625/g.751  ORF Transcript_625/g.751 Transcript_625/m.751 type:complete len:511 (-) Transcript_625:46-1578(-)